MKARDSRIELLRIICMFFIVLSHFSLYGNWYGTNDFSSLETVRTLLFNPLGAAAAVCFFIITGYFSVKKESFKSKEKKSISKFVNVWTQTFFYSSIIGIILFFTKKVGLVSLLKSFLPLTLSEYWFVTCYLLLMIFSPYLDLIGDKLSNRSFLRLLIILSLLQIPALLKNAIVNQFFLALLGYFSGKYIYLNKEKFEKIRKRFLCSLLIIIYLIDLLSIFVMRSIGVQFQRSGHFTGYLLAFCFAVCMFLLAINTKAFSNRLINEVAKSVFGVYLITEQSGFRDILWGKILNVGQFQSSFLFPLQGIIVTFLVYIGCISIDFVRRKIFKFIKLG